MSKGLHLLSAISGVLLNLGLMLLPSILSGVPQLVLVDRRLATFLLIISLWVILDSSGSEREYVHGLQIQARWLPYLMSASMLFVFLASLTEEALNGASPFTLPATIGGFSMIAGVLLRRFSIHALGIYFLDEVAIASGQSLVTTGIYSHLRHPSETGNLCIAFGSTLLLGSPGGLVICIFVLLPVVLIRVQFEDRLLMRHYPKLFTAYARDVPALLPGSISKLSH